jgi:hypothetical protein
MSDAFLLLTILGALLVFAAVTALVRSRVNGRRHKTDHLISMQ